MPATQRLNNDLILALRQLNIDHVRDALGRGADPNYGGDGPGQLPLAIAILARDPESAALVDLLLKAGANPNALTSNSRPLLHLAGSVHNPEALSALIQAGARTDVLHGARRMNLIAAILAPESMGVPRSLRRIVNKGAERVIACLRIACEAGLKPQAPVMSGEVSAVHLGALHADPRVIQTVVDLGAPLSALDTLKRTPLHWAAEEGHAEVCSFLIGAGHPQDCADGQGRSPEDLVRRGAPGWAQTTALFRAADMKRMLALPRGKTMAMGAA